MNFLAVLVLLMFIAVESSNTTEDKTFNKESEIKGRNEHNVSLKDTSQAQTKKTHSGRNCEAGVATLQYKTKKPRITDKKKKIIET